MINDLNKILNLDIPSRVKEEFKNKLEKRVYYSYNDKTITGILYGATELGDYIIKCSENYYTIPNTYALFLLS